MEERMKPIYRPKGAALEYGDYAVNIYTGCPHRCFYCYSPQVLHRDWESFHSCVEPHKDIVGELRRQLEREQITGKLIHLCFTCDPCTKFQRIRPQYCRLCAGEFLERSEQTYCPKCRSMRKKQAQRKYAVLARRRGGEGRAVS